MKLENVEMINIVGGVNLTGSLVDAFVKGINAVLDMGRSLGTALRMLINKKRC